MILLPLLLAGAEVWQSAPDRVSRGIGGAFATCMVAHHREQVRATLAMPFGDEDSVAGFGKLFDPLCVEIARDGPSFLPNQLTFPPLVARGLLYEALYHSERRDRITLVSASSATNYAFAAASKPSELSRNYRALMRIGDCYVRAEPGKAKALLATEAGSKSEAKAIAALGDAWTSCMPGGKQLPFSAAMVRGTLVEPLYRMTQAAL